MARLRARITTDGPGAMLQYGRGGRSPRKGSLEAAGSRPAERSIMDRRSAAPGAGWMGQAAPIRFSVDHGSPIRGSRRRRERIQTSPPAASSPTSTSATARLLASTNAMASSP